MSVSIALTSTSASSPALVRLANGEYTADSVAKDPKDATRLNLVLEKDGNYGASPPAAADGATAARSSSTVLAGLSSLKLGGA